MATAKKPSTKKTAGKKKAATGKRKEGLKADGKTLKKGYKYLKGGRIVKAKSFAFGTPKTKRSTKKR